MGCSAGDANYNVNPNNNFICNLNLEACKCMFCMKMWKSLWKTFGDDLQKYGI